MSEPIAILDVIKRGGYEASLITTFNAHLPFYEEVVLRRLVSAGCRHNVVLMDRNQCSVSWGSEATRPRLAGHAYTLLPIEAPGAFHPKVCILVGPKRASILVGSHNLTLSGFGYNREVTNWIEVSGAKDSDGAALLADTWHQVMGWVELARGKAPDSMLSASLALANFINPLISKVTKPADVVMLGQTPKGLALLDQLVPLAGEGVKRIGVLGAFFDRELALIIELKARWPAAEVVVGVDPDSVHLEASSNTLPARFVDARKLWESNSNAYLHAKIIFLDTGKQDSLLVSGSANPSRPAWLGTATSCNVEAVLVRKGPEALQTATEIGMAKLFTLPAIDNATFKAIAVRSAATRFEASDAGSRLLLGIADPDMGLIRVPLLGAALNADAAELLDPDHTVLRVVGLEKSSGDELIVRAGKDTPIVQSCRILRKGEPVARVMIHHPDVIAASSQSSRQHQIRNALSALGSNEADISSVIASVEKVIFSDDTQRHVELAIQDKKQRSSNATASARPESLAVSVEDLPSEKRKQRFLKSGDLAYLLDVLIHRLGEGLESGTVETDAVGRTEEEQVDQDDDNRAEEGQHEQGATELSDPEIASIVARKVRQLIRRMDKQFERAADELELQPSAVLQLIAVLALLRELRHLEKTPRWRKTGQPLVEEEWMRFLLDDSIIYLLGSSTGLMHRVEEIAGSHSEEIVQLRVLLLWLAWDLGDELTDHVSRLLEKDELDARLQANALFLELIPPLVSDESARAELEKSISRTLWPTPQASLRAHEWLERHWGYGRSWQHKHEQEAPLSVGSIGYVPGIITNPRVVIDVSSGMVGLWDFDKVRHFVRDKVITVRPNLSSDLIK